MSAHDSDPSTDDPTGESFVERWSRLKQRSREREAQVEAPLPATDPAAPEAAASAAGAPPVVELPDLAQMNQDSDYSAFLTPGVDAALRRRALRQLFSSPKFNVFDGLDTYRDDFRNFAPLGDIVTADMRYQIERLAKAALEATDVPATDRESSSAAMAATAAPDRVPESQDPLADTSPPDTAEHLDHRPE